MFGKSVSIRTAILLTLIILTWGREEHVTVQRDILPIGQVQGYTDSSPYVTKEVRFRGIVTGLFEDQNVSGIRYHTFFVQNVPAESDGDPRTSDGIAVFTGRSRADVAVGDIVDITGTITEFYGLTEVDDKALRITVISRNNPYPVTITIDPPSNNNESAAYLEQFEGMLVDLPQARVVGPTHSGCGFAVVRADTGQQRIIALRRDDPHGTIIEILNVSDFACNNVPSVGYGDQITGLSGPLIYHFDRFKIVQQSFSNLTVFPAKRTSEPLSITDAPGIVSLTTFNLGDYFDSLADGGLENDPVPTPMEVSVKRQKLAYAIGVHTSCPAIAAVQEVENQALLTSLVNDLRQICGFTYSITHRDAPDARGSDVALLSDPSYVVVKDVFTHQTCSMVLTDVWDPASGCDEGQMPLYSRPPLQIDTLVLDQKITFFVIHFKSKRGGESETEAQRLAQANHLADLVGQMQRDEPDRSFVIMGDFNDYEQSAVMEILVGDALLVHALASIPGQGRYSYIFGGMSQLIDWILVSPSLAEKVISAEIAHVNADYPYTLSGDISPSGLPFRSSDHDLPLVTLNLAQSAGANPAIAESGSEQSEVEHANDLDLSATLLPVLIIVVGIVVLVEVVIRRRGKSGLS